MLPLLPALLAALSGVWCGTFYSGASFLGSTAAVALPLVLLIAAGDGGAPWDPLRLGRAGRLLPAALWIAAAASAWASPVPRAGRFALVLLPAYLALPGAVARCWPAEPARRIGLRALSGVVGGVALLSLAGLVFLRTGRASLPLGHHNLLAAWLVILLPPALLPAREAGRWRGLGGASGAATVVAVLASRSFLGLGGLAIEGLALAILVGRGRRGRRIGIGLLLGLLILGGIVAGRRAGQILSGADPSAQARAVYYHGGWEGFFARPLLGWGPGSAAWTASRFLRPRPGVSPASEVVGELHSLPVELGYELGATGLLLGLGLAVLFVLRRGAERQAAADRTLLLAGLLGLLGAGVVSLGNAALAVTALPVAAALAAGAALAGGAAPQGGGTRLPAGLYAAAVLLLLLSPLCASYHYERAIAAPTPQAAREQLARAVALDPAFPLYRARLGWLLAAEPGERAAGAEKARRAARDAPGVASLWLAAGVLGLGERPWAAEALGQSCALDPLAPFAPYFLAVAARQSADAPFHAAHALLAEPRLLAATFWDDHRPLLGAALREAGSREGVDPGWREALLAAARRLPSTADAGARSWLALEIDEVPSLALSLHAFRRPPWPLEWPLVEVRQTALPGPGLPPATALHGGNTAAFRCRP